MIEGTVLNERYKILKEIGRGGMAYVYKAIDQKLNREVAVKVLRDEFVENEAFIKKFDRESQAAAGLSHPNIVSVYDVGVEDNIYYIIMEYVDGITLKQYLTSKGHLDYVEATQYILEVAGALKCAHEHKIIHRDIKPHNILLTKELAPKVADFGIARAITSSTVTMTNQAMGSVHYVSPEQARGGFVDECSDLYSLGIMYYELLTGQVPFDAESSVSIAIKQIQEPIVPPQQLNPDIPDAVNEVVLKLTQKKPDDRYHSAEELIVDLDILLDDLEATLPNNSVQTGPLDTIGTEIFTETDTDPIEPYTEEIADDEQIDKRKFGLWLAAALLAILLVLIGAFYLTNLAASRRVLVPDVTNLTFTEAQEQLKNAGLEAEIERETYDSNVPQGRIISQNPATGSSVSEGSKVKLTISQGSQTVALPDVIGQSEERASTVLSDAGFGVNIQREFNSDFNNGIVYSTNPNPGTELVQGQTVTILVSKGEDTVAVPSITGVLQSEAENRLARSGLNVGSVTQQASSTYSAGTVISQMPSSGEKVERGTYVSFIVSSGPPTTYTPNNESSGSNSGGSGNSYNPGSSGNSSGNNSGSGNNSSGSGSDHDHNSDDTENQGTEEGSNSKPSSGTEESNSNNTSPSAGNESTRSSSSGSRESGE